jgi:hypothetical protein
MSSACEHFLYPATLKRTIIIKECSWSKPFLCEELLITGTGKLQVSFLALGLFLADCSKLKGVHGQQYVTPMFCI